jgi:acyl-CoA dehydrogenase
MPATSTTSIVRDGDDYVINGRKWWASNAMDPRCRILIVMGKTDPDGPKHRQQSMVLVPTDTPGVTIERSTKVFGFTDRDGHAEVTFEDVRVPVSNLLAGGGRRVHDRPGAPGPGTHPPLHARDRCGRAGAEADVRTGHHRIAFGRPLADQGMVHEAIAESRVAIDQARLYVQQAAWKIDEVGAKGAPSRSPRSSWSPRAWPPR